VSRESAVLHVSLPQEQAQALLPLATHLTAFLLILSLTYSLDCCRKLLTTHKPLHLMSPVPTLRTLVPPRRQPESHWWGPQQQSWNPSMN
jgi:hypothetical protein